MAQFDYAKSKATADRLIGRFGMPAVLRVPTSTGPVYDPTPGAPKDYPCTVVVRDFSTYEVTAAGGRVLTKDKKVILAKGNLPLDPSPAHKLLLGGVEHVIVGPDVGLGIKTVAPGGVTVLYQLQVRR